MNLFALINKLLETLTLVGGLMTRLHVLEGEDAPEPLEILYGYAVDKATPTLWRFVCDLPDPNMVLLHAKTYRISNMQLGGMAVISHQIIGNELYFVVDGDTTVDSFIVIYTYYIP